MLETNTEAREDTIRYIMIKTGTCLRLLSIKERCQRQELRGD